MSGRSPRWIRSTQSISTLDVGSIVKINENRRPVEYYIARHNYESELNGDGLALLVRKLCGDDVAFSTGANAYTGGTLDDYLNNTFFSRFDSSVRRKIALTEFYYTPGNGVESMTTLQRKVFQPSSTEYGLYVANVNAEGTALPIADTLRSVQHAQWTRTPYLYNNSYIVSVTASGGRKYNTSATAMLGSRPAFCLPESTAFDDDMLIA